MQRRVSLRLGDGKAHFVAPKDSSLSFDYLPGAVELGDVDNDGNLDLGVASKEGKKENVRIFLGNQKGGFSLAPGFPFTASAAIRWYKPSLRFADLNRDGKLDLLVANGRRNTVETFLGDGRAGFFPEAIVRLEPGRWLYSFALGDMDGDGLLDLVSASTGHQPDSDPGRVATRQGNGKGGFAPAAGQNLVVPDPRVAALVDVNGDGRLDMVLSHGRSNMLSILLNDGRGRFTSQPGPPTHIVFPAADAVAADVNEDKKADLVLATVNIAAAPFESRIVVLLGDGHGKFTPAPGSPFRAGPEAYRVAVADLNEDGKLDIVASSFEGNAVTLLWGR